MSGLSGNDGRIYELIVRHFLACVSRDAIGSETVVNAQIVDETFTATGLVIHERNYLEVYKYDKWTGKEMHPYQQGEQFNPTELALKEGSTTAPTMLTEAELIALMDKHGIGTDATHADHINTIKERCKLIRLGNHRCIVFTLSLSLSQSHKFTVYIAENERRYLIPGTLGMGLVEGYESVDLPLAKPQLRANFEKDLKLICDGQKQPADVLREHVRIHKEAFQKIIASASTIDATLSNRLQETPVVGPEPQATTQFQEVHKCPRCSAMVAMKTMNENRIMLTCLGYPACNQSMWLPQEYFKEAVVTENVCENCGPGYKKIKLKLKGMHLVSFLNANNVEGLSYVTCPACDRSLKDLCAQDNVRQNTGDNSSRQGNNSTVVADSTRNNGNYINPNTRNNRGGQNTSRANRTNTSTNDRVGNSRANSSNQGNGNNSRRPPDDNNTEVKCPKCGKVLTPITSHTATNPGRQFYKCCDYFKWADEMATASGSTTSTTTTSRNTNTTNPTNRQRANNSSSQVMCTNCNKPAVLRTVTKEGSNKGKQFYNCPDCNFWLWADNVSSTQSGPSSGASRSRNTGEFIKEFNFYVRNVMNFSPYIIMKIIRISR